MTFAELPITAALTEWIELVARERMLTEAREIQRACESALQGGIHGVLIARRNDGTLVSAEVNPFVPYGQIYEFINPTPDAAADHRSRR
ncbi:MAG TPA: hypothetical protein VJX66_31965 [Amycolatopsis sp.]|nr:hypothetical protein [Amycolatopsis sp.]